MTTTLNQASTGSAIAERCRAGGCSEDGAYRSLCPVHAADHIRMEALAARGPRLAAQERALQLADMRLSEETG